MGNRRVWEPGASQASVEIPLTILKMRDTQTSDRHTRGSKESGSQAKIESADKINAYKFPKLVLNHAR